MTTRKPDAAEAVHGLGRTHAEGAPEGAPGPATETPRRTVPAGDPVAPVRSVESESVGAPQQGASGAPQGGATGAPQGGAATPADPATASDPGTASEQAGPQDGTPTAGTAPADAAAEDHERQLELDLEELTAKAEKADEYLELAQRTRADFDNYRKRAAREAAVAQERGVAKLAKELLPAVDNLDRALEAAQAAVVPEGEPGPADNGTATLISGIKLVHDDVIAALARAGIEGFSPKGERFDPQLHEAIAQQPVEGAEPGTVVEVYQRGYRLGEVVIRPARVVVAA